MNGYVKIITTQRNSEEYFLITISGSVDLFIDFVIKKEDWVKNLLEFFEKCSEEQLKKIGYFLRKDGPKIERIIDIVLLEVLKYKYYLKFKI